MTDFFRTRDHVPDFDAICEDYRKASDSARVRHRSLQDVSYGDGPDERLDLFFPDAQTDLAPIHLFIHGGYWRAFRKDDYAFMAEPVVAAGAIAAIIEYSLMPQFRMAHLIEQTRRAAAWLAHNGVSFGGAGTRVTASGHSAGAHLAFYLVARAPHESAWPNTQVKDVLLASGIYDLEPLSRSFLQAEVSLTEQEVSRWSPLRASVREDAKIRTLVGAREMPPFHQQARALVAHHGGEHMTLEGLNHMTVVRELGRPGTPAAEALQSQIQSS